MTHHVQDLLDHLASEGFPAHLDADGDIAFKCEGFAYVLCFDADDAAYGKLVVPNVWSIDSEAELAQVLTALDNINRKMKVVKGHTQRDQVWFTVELWLDDQSQWKRFLPRAIRALTHALALLAQQMRADGAAPPPPTPFVEPLRPSI